MKARKIFSVIALTLVLAIAATIFVGCSQDPDPSSSVYSTIPSDSSAQNSSSGLTEDEVLKQPFEMQQVGHSTSANFLYYRDTTTDVLYVWAASKSGAGLTALLDPATGLPLTYTRYLELNATKNLSAY